MSSHQATSESQNRPRKMRRGTDGIRKNREILGTLGFNSEATSVYCCQE